jgi:hypothetical protein
MRKPLALTAVALCLLLVAPAASLAYLPAFRSTLIAPGRSIAGIRLHGSFASARRAIVGSTHGCTGGAGCSFSHGQSRLAFFMAGSQPHRKPFVDRVAINMPIEQATARHPAVPEHLAVLKTARGIGLGSTLGALERAYPNVTGRTRVLGYWTLKGPGGRSTQFSVSSGHIYAIAIQAARVR